MTEAHPDHHHKHDHEHHGHHHHGAEPHSRLGSLSLIQASALTRLVGALILLLPLWVAVYWVVAA
jgi:hypothetical protein